MTTTIAFGGPGSKRKRRKVSYWQQARRVLFITGLIGLGVSALDAGVVFFTGQSLYEGARGSGLFVGGVGASLASVMGLIHRSVR